MALLGENQIANLVPYGFNRNGKPRINKLPSKAEQILMVQRAYSDAENESKAIKKE